MPRDEFLLEARSRIPVDDAERDRKLRRPEPEQELSERRVRLVVHEDLVGTLLGVDDRERERARIEPEPLAAVFAEHERLAVLDAELRVRRVLLLRERGEDVVVVDDAV